MTSTVNLTFSKTRPLKSQGKMCTAKGGKTRSIRCCLSQLELLSRNTTDWVAWTAVFDFSAVEAGKSKIEVPADLVAGEDPLPSGALTQQREKALVSSLSYNGVSPAMGVPSSRPYQNQFISQRPHLQILSHWGVKASVYLFGGGIHSVHNRHCLFT